jgi:hypothetical protein
MILHNAAEQINWKRPVTLLSCRLIWLQSLSLSYHSNLLISLFFFYLYVHLYLPPAYESWRERGAELNKTTEKSVGLFHNISLALGQVLILMKGLLAPYCIVALTTRGTLPPS